jgi:hypothetical protein
MQVSPALSADLLMRQLAQRRANQRRTAVHNGRNLQETLTMIVPIPRLATPNDAHGLWAFPETPKAAAG